MCDFLHHFLRRTVTWSELPGESDWEKLRFFGFAVGEPPSNPDFMQKTGFRAKALKVAKSKNDVERDRGKKAKSDVLARTVMDITFSPFNDQGRLYLRYARKKCLKHSSFKADLDIGFACFDYTVFLLLPKNQAIECFRHILQSFTSPGWLSRELRNIHMDGYVELRMTSDTSV